MRYALATLIAAHAAATVGGFVALIFIYNLIW